MRFRSLAVPLLLVSVAMSPRFVAADDSKVAKDDAEAHRKLGRQILSKFRSEYRSFTQDVVRSRTKPAAERIAIVKKHAAAIDAVLKDHAKGLAVKQVLPEMANVMGIDLAPFLMTVIKENPHQDVQALAAFTLAVHLHKTGRDEARSIALLKLVQKKYGKQPYGDSTLGEFAARQLYEIENLTIGKPAPDVEGVDADGAKFRLSDYQGKVIVLRFWGDWCPFCRAMFPQERELVNTLRDKPFVLIGVNSDPRPRLKKAQKEKNLVWRSFWDGGDTGGPIARSFQVTEWPTIYVIDHNGIIRDKGEGVRGGRAKWLEPVLKKLIAEAERDAKIISTK